jgi:hypothetical protein
VQIYLKYQSTEKKKKKVAENVRASFQENQFQVNEVPRASKNCCQTNSQQEQTELTKDKLGEP